MLNFHKRPLFVVYFLITEIYLFNYECGVCNALSVLFNHEITDLLPDSQILCTSKVDTGPHIAAFFP